MKYPNSLPVVLLMGFIYKSQVFAGFLDKKSANSYRLQPFPIFLSLLGMDGHLGKKLYIQQEEVVGNFPKKILENEWGWNLIFFLALWKRKKIRKNSANFLGLKRRSFRFSWVFFSNRDWLSVRFLKKIVVV